jgi:LPXTG-site transpeptidase (sortase) family protein
MRILSYIFAALGLLALGYWAVESGRTWLFQANEQRRFAIVEQAAPLPVEAPPIRPYPSTGSPVAVLAIPRLEMSMVVVEGSGATELKLAPGHIPGTAFPGSGGNVGIAGHRDTFFRPLRLIHPDDAIQIETHERTYQYRVVSTAIVDPADVAVLRPSGHESLTLVTCYPFDFVGRAPKRFIVTADLRP